jgi:hypothetical protein
MTTRSFNFLESFLRRKLDLPEIPADKIAARISAHKQSGTWSEGCLLTIENFRLDITGKTLSSDRLKELIGKFCAEVGVTISTRQVPDRDAVYVIDPTIKHEYKIFFSINQELLITVEYNAPAK